MVFNKWNLLALSKWGKVQIIWYQILYLICQVWGQCYRIVSEGGKDEDWFRNKCSWAPRWFFPPNIATHFPAPKIPPFISIHFITPTPVCLSFTFNLYRGRRLFLSFIVYVFAFESEYMCAFNRFRYVQTKHSSFFYFHSVCLSVNVCAVK